MKKKATIYDYVRMCNYFDDVCYSCPLRDKQCDLNYIKSNEYLDEVNEIILNWRKEHPAKTRQDKFLEMFPNVIKNNGIIAICPREVESYLNECNNNCLDCKKSYWLTEVEE